MGIQNTADAPEYPCSTKDAVPATEARIRTWLQAHGGLSSSCNLSNFCRGKWTAWGCNEDSHCCILSILKDSLDLGHYPGVQYCSGVIFAGRKGSLSCFHLALPTMIACFTAKNNMCHSASRMLHSQSWIQGLEIRQQCVSADIVDLEKAGLWPSAHLKLGPKCLLIRSHNEGG